MRIILNWLDVILEILILSWSINRIPQLLYETQNSDKFSKENSDEMKSIIISCDVLSDFVPIFFFELTNEPMSFNYEIGRWGWILPFKEITL